MWYYPAMSKSGPKPERFTLGTDPVTAMQRAVRKPKPVGGWPKPSPMPQRARKGKRRKSA